MIRKSDLSLRIGMIMMFLCAALVLTMLPAAADYNADNPLVTHTQGTVTGGMNYTIGNSSYSPKIWNNDSDTGVVDHYNVELTPGLPAGATNVSARLYVYWTWSYINDLNTKYNAGKEAEMALNFDNQYTFADPDNRYVDWKNNSQQGTHNVDYNYPSGTYAYNVTDYVDATNSSRTYYVNISNSYPYVYDPSTAGNDSQSFNIQAVGLLVLYNVSGSTETKSYWIDEGCDLTNVGKFNATDCSNDTGIWDITPDQAVSLANFTNVDTSNANSAKLITCVPSGGTPYNRLYVNYFFNYPSWQNIKYWDGLWNKSPYSDFSWTRTEVYNNLIDDKTNYVGFQNGLYSMVPLGKSEGQMQAANAFLLLENTTN
jgi:hypothetical protein